MTSHKPTITLLLIAAVGLVLFVGLGALPGDNELLRVVLGWIVPFILIGIAILIGITGRKGEDEITRPPLYHDEFDGRESEPPDDQPETPEKPKNPMAPALITLGLLLVSFFARVIVKQFEEFEYPTQERSPTVARDTTIAPRLLPDTTTAPPSPPAPKEPTDPGLPRFGDYVYVDELPEPIRKIAPEYPEVAREAQVQGTVMVHALVNREGRVVQTRVTESIRLLDDAAIAAVRQWKFKPAMFKGEPVAVWVAVPVTFTLH